jgi:LAGLIDADG endonuclease
MQKVQAPDNATGADNQQERLVRLGWVIGFVDGEGCFSISLVRQPHRTNRRGYKTGYQVTHEFIVTQGEKSVSVLHELCGFFGVGYVYRNKRNDNHKEDLCHYAVSARSDLLKVIIPFFQQHPLQTAKRQDFEKFARCVNLISKGHHTTYHGLADLLEIMQTMNHQKPRHELIKILRDHTPDIQDMG